MFPLAFHRFQASVSPPGLELPLVSLSVPVSVSPLGFLSASALPSESLLVPASGLLPGSPSESGLLPGSPSESGLLPASLSVPALLSASGLPPALALLPVFLSVLASPLESALPLFHSPDPRSLHFPADPVSVCFPVLEQYFLLHRPVMRWVSPAVPRSSLHKRSLSEFPSQKE